VIVRTQKELSRDYKVKAWKLVDVLIDGYGITTPSMVFDSRVQPLQRLGPTQLEGQSSFDLPMASRPQTGQVTISARLRLEFVGVDEPVFLSTGQKHCLVTDE
jgi:hypothetical protein